MEAGQLANTLSCSLMFTPRYLVPFDPKQIPHYFADVLVIGGGLAGLRAALEVDDSLSVLVVTKDRCEESNSTYAQGGIASVMDPDDRFEDHIADTLTAGGSLCDPEVVEMVIRDAPERIQELIDWGTNFDESQGQLHLSREGGHSHNRILHALGDATGKEIMRVVIERARQKPNVALWRNTFTLDVLTKDGACRGSLVWNSNHGKTLIWAKQTILCTGGAGQIYRESTNPLIATGDGHALAFRAGAELRDLELVQFHPTVLYIAGSSRSLVTEAMRGEGAHLVDEQGDRFMHEFDPRGELAPRDIVAQAIVTHMERTRRPNVFLDLSHLDSDFVRARFPGIARTCHEFGIDIATEPIPVRPGAHYMIGGLRVDQSASSTLPGLWAAGEVTSSGLHGANRLASNSLLEGLVYGALAGRGASSVALQMPDDFRALSISNPSRPDGHEQLDLPDIRNSLKSLMWRAAGVRREGGELDHALRTISDWCRYVLDRQFSDPHGWELQNMLIVSRLIIQAAKSREESRGVHYRADFPETNDALWNRHQAFVRTENDESA